MAQTGPISEKRGAKMNRARVQSNQDAIVKAEEFNKQKHGEVVCFFCRCRVKGTPTYSRNRGDQQMTVAGYFSLWPGVSRDSQCRFDIGKTVQKWVAYSRAIRNIDRDAQPILERMAQGQPAEFILHILVESIEKFRYGFRANRPRWHPAEESDELGNDYIQTNKVLKPYFRSSSEIERFAGISFIST